MFQWVNGTLNIGLFDNNVNKIFPFFLNSILLAYLFTYKKASTVYYLFIQAGEKVGLQ